MEATINELFEPCPPLVELLLPHLDLNDPIPTTIEKSRGVLLALINRHNAHSEIPREEEKLICDIVGAHPRLGVPKSTPLSDFSSVEQRSLAVGDPRLAAKLVELNSKYEKTFPGLRFVVWVNGRSRDEIMAIMEQRILANDWMEEVRQAFNAMADIALDRFRKAKL